MEELIKRLERVIATGAPDKDGMHPISAETVLEVVKELSERGTDCISRQQAIDAMTELQGSTSSKGVLKGIGKARKRIEQLPLIQPEIVRCKDCRYYNSEEKECLDLLGHGRRWEEDDFCSYAERREVTE